MKTLKVILLTSTLCIFNHSLLAMTEDEVKALLLPQYPDADITEIEKETYQGEKVWEVDFKSKGTAYEAIISLQGKLIKAQKDD